MNRDTVFVAVNFPKGVAVYDKIAHLIEQAEAAADTEYAQRQTGYSREDIFRQEFAELIVRTCADICIATGEADNSPYGAIAWDCAENIEQHFEITNV